MNTQDQTLALRREEPSLIIMLQGMIDKGVTADNVAAFGQLLTLQEKLTDKQAERDFNAAFAKLQSEIPTIVAESEIPKRGKYARFENVMHQIQPMLTANGFSVSFEQKPEDKRITVTCHLRHIAGHSTATAFGVRVSGNSDSETQADCKASTTAKRNSLLQALNIVVRQDCLQSEEDPHNESGQTITQNQADQLRELCDESKSDRKKFLIFADSETFEGIRSNRFDGLVATLNRKMVSK